MEDRVGQAGRQGFDDAAVALVEMTQPAKRAIDVLLAQRIRAGELPADHPGLRDHLVRSVLSRIAIDNPRYPSLREAAEWLVDQGVSELVERGQGSRGAERPRHSGSAVRIVDGGVAWPAERGVQVAVGKGEMDAGEVASRHRQVARLLGAAVWCERILGPAQAPPLP